ncbi:MAG: hypothetical protein WBM50_07580 [Acidimicrobiales bacterium]
MHSLTRPGRLAGIALALSLVASACGSEADPVDVASESSAPETSLASEGSAPETSTGSSDGTQAPTTEADGPAVPPRDEDDETAGPAESHLFPDLNTVNIVDGATVNLAEELAGGDTPVLLWFWAPH